MKCRVPIYSPRWTLGLWGGYLLIAIWGSSGVAWYLNGVVWCVLFFFSCDPLFAVGFVDLPKSPRAPDEQLHYRCAYHYVHSNT